MARNADRPSRLRAVRLAAALVVACAVLAVAPASAQQRREHRSILNFLFGRHEAPSRRAPDVVRPQRHKPVRRREPQAAGRRAAPPPATPTVEKNADAREVLVVGDFVASGLADGLKEAFSEAAGITVVERTKGSSGLVRDDYYDWPEAIGPTLDAEKPAAVVVMIGANDRQAIRVDGNGEPVRSDTWTAAYTARVEALAKAVRNRHLPLLWVGMPAFQSSSMSKDILAFDGIYRDVVTKAGGEFIDTWDGFVDAEGGFVFTGSDVNGQQARLRGSDGINFTRAGKRKLAVYVEKPIRRLLGGAAGDVAAPIALPEADSGEPAMQGPQLPAAIMRTPAIGFQDPGLDGDTALLGASPLTSPPDTPRARLVNDGTLAPPPAGRADDFAWKQRHDEAGASSLPHPGGGDRIVSPDDAMRVATPSR